VPAFGAIKRNGNFLLAGFELRDDSLPVHVEDVIEQIGFGEALLALGSERVMSVEVREEKLSHAIGDDERTIERVQKARHQAENLLVHTLLFGRTEFRHTASPSVHNPLK